MPLQNLQWELDSSEQGRLGFKEFLELITRLLQEMDQAREGWSWSHLENSNQPKISLNDTHLPT